MNLPQFKADRLDGKGEVIGAYYKDAKGHLIVVHSFTDLSNNNEIYVSAYQINPETLKQKIGDEWYSMEEVEKYIAFTEAWSNKEKLKDITAEQLMGMNK